MGAFLCPFFYFSNRALCKTAFSMKLHKARYFHEKQAEKGIN